MNAPNDHNEDEERDDVMSQTRENQGSPGRGKESDPRQTITGTEMLSQPLRNASELGEHSSTDQLNLPERLETIHHMAHVESKVIVPQSIARIEENHAGDEKNKAAGRFGHRSLAGDKKPLGLKPITVQIFQIPDQMQEKRTVEVVATSEELKARVPRQGLVVNIGLGPKGSFKQLHTFDNRQKQFAQPTIPQPKGLAALHHYPPQLPAVSKNSVARHLQKLPNDYLLGPLASTTDAKSLQRGLQTGRVAPTTLLPAKLTGIASSQNRNSQPGGFDSGFISVSTSEVKHLKDVKASTHRSSQGKALTMQRERTDGTQIGEDASPEVDEKSVEVVERKKAAIKHASLAKRGQKEESSKGQSHPLADVGSMNLSAGEGDEDASALTPGSPSAHQVSAYMVKAACASRTRETGGSEVTRHTPEAEDGAPIVEARDNKLGISSGPKQTAGTNGADHHDQRNRNIKELNTLSSRQGPPRKAIGDQDHSRYTSYPAVLPQKNFRNLKATLDAQISVDHQLAIGTSADTNLNKDARAVGDLRENSLYSNPDATETLETFKNYKNNVLNLPSVDGYRTSVFSEDHDQALTARSSAGPQALYPGTHGLTMHTSSAVGKAGAKVEAAGEGEGTSITANTQRNQNLRSPPSLFSMDQSKHGRSIRDSAACTPSYRHILERDKEASRTAYDPQDQVKKKRHFHLKRLTATQESGQGGHTMSFLQENHIKDPGAFSISNNGLLNNTSALPLRMKKNSVVVQLKQTLDNSHQEKDNQDSVYASQVSQRFSFQSLPAQQSCSVRMSPAHEKFRFLKKLIQREEQLGLKTEQTFVPYTQERSGFGQLLEADRAQEFEDLDLHKQIQQRAVRKRNDPARLTTEQNLRKTQQNAKMKISEQIKFSKRNDLAFQASRTAGRSIDSWQQKLSFGHTDVNKQEFHKDTKQPQQATVAGIQVGQPGRYLSPTPIQTLHGAEATNTEDWRTSTSTTKQALNIHNFERNLVGITAGKRSSVSPANSKAETMKELLLKGKTASDQLYRTFRVNLPGSTSQVPAAVQRSSTVRRPMPHARHDVQSFIKPQIFDLVREQTKDQIREHLKFLSPREQDLFESDRQIPFQALAPHIEDFQDYPVDHSYEPETNTAQTFGGTPRFPAVRCNYTDHAKKLSILDFHRQVFVSANTAPHLGKYTRRPEHFLTRSQERQLRAEAAEEAMRAQRQQQLRTANDQDVKDRDKQPGVDHRSGSRPPDGQHSISFPYGDHIEALTARPHIKDMINRIKYEARAKAPDKVKDEA